MSEAPRHIVTGAAGFIGANLVGELLRRDPDARILAVDDLRSGSFANLVGACDRLAHVAYPGELRTSSIGEVDWASVIEEFHPDAVFHLAAITDTTVADERTMMRVNMEDFRTLLHTCVTAGAPLVYASSAATYGSPQEGRDRTLFPESAAGKPNNIYGFSKWMMENLHRAIAEQCVAQGNEDPRVVGLRFFNVFGPGESHKGEMASLVFQLSRQILAGGRPRLFTAGEQARDQVHVMDVVGCMLAAAGPGANPGVYNCGSGVATTFNDLANAVRDGLGVREADAPTDYFNMPDDVRAFYQDYTAADLTLVTPALGWSPRFTPIDAIRDEAARLAHLDVAPESIDSRS